CRQRGEAVALFAGAGGGRRARGRQHGVAARADHRQGIGTRVTRFATREDRSSTAAGRRGAKARRALYVDRSSLIDGLTRLRPSFPYPFGVADPDAGAAVTATSPRALDMLFSASVALMITPCDPRSPSRTSSNCSTRESGMPSFG